MNKKRFSIKSTFILIMFLCCSSCLLYSLLGTFEESSTIEDMAGAEVMELRGSAQLVFEDLQISIIDAGRGEYTTQEGIQHKGLNAKLFIIYGTNPVNKETKTVYVGEKMELGNYLVKVVYIKDKQFIIRTRNSLIVRFAIKKLE